jgi:hypothetical protein
MTKEVFDLEDGEVVGCYFCMRAGCHDDHGKGSAFLAGPDHSPYDGNANYVCIDHLDEDAVLPDCYPTDYIDQRRNHEYETVVSKRSRHSS